MKLLVLGKTSYVGTSVKNYCEKAHPELTIDTVSSRPGGWENVSFSGYDAVYNVSGLCHADSKHGTPEMYKAINTDLPVEMACKAKGEGVKMFIQMSSTIIYGNMSRIGEGKFIDTKTAPSPINVYGESKLNAENELLKLEDEHFKIVILRCPLIYGENARDNFPRLVRFAKTMPIFPDIENKQSMIYADNLAELIYLIVLKQKPGIYMPQDKDYICTSQLVKDIAEASGRKLTLTKVFNPAIRLLSKKIYLFNKVFGDVAYKKDVSNYFDGKYRIVEYREAVRRIAASEQTA